MKKFYTLLGLSFLFLSGEGGHDSSSSSSSDWKKWEPNKFVTFEDITSKSGIGEKKCSNSESFSNFVGIVAVFDCDNDGYDDILFGNAPGFNHQLFHNNGDETFKEILPEESGLDSLEGATSILAIDYNNDGNKDLVFSSSVRYYLRFYRNDGNCHFTDETNIIAPLVSVIENQEGEQYSSSFGGTLTASDYDQDGDIDIIVGSYGNAVEALAPHGRQLMLWINRLNDVEIDGNKLNLLQFVPISYPPFIPQNIFLVCGVTFEDFNEDGWDDLIISQCNSPSGGSTYLWLNVPYKQYFDPDADSFYDDKRIFIDVTQDTGFGVYGSKGFPMSQRFGDFNGDNHFDILMTDMGGSFQTDVFAALTSQVLNIFPLSKGTIDAPTRLFQSVWEKRKKHFKGYQNIIEDVGVNTEETGWGSLMTDLDNDGWDDVIVQGNFFNVNRRTNPGFVYRNVKRKNNNNNNNDKYKYKYNKHNKHNKQQQQQQRQQHSNRVAELKQTLNLQDINTYGLSYLDYNKDGYVDFVINSACGTGVNQYKLFQNNGLLNTNSHDGYSRNYLDIELRGDVYNQKTNYYGLGSLVKVYIQQINYYKKQKLRVGDFGSTDASYVHFGIPLRLNQPKPSAKVVVEWMGSKKIQTFYNIQLNQRIILRESS